MSFSRVCAWAYTGTFSRLVTIRSPLIWSEWSWVMKIPRIALSGMPQSPNACISRLQDTPASISTPPWGEPTKLALPLLELNRG